MSEPVNFDLKKINKKTRNLEKSLEDMDKKLKDVLKKFILKLPEAQGIVAAQVETNPEEKARLQAKSEYDNIDDLWKGIAKDGVEPTLDDLIKYISENFSAELEAETIQLENELSILRGECIKTCKESAIELIKLQDEAVRRNDEIIAQEKESLEESRRIKQEKEAEKTRLEAERDAMSDGPDKDDKQAEIDYIVEKINEQNIIIDTLTTGDDSIEKHEEKQAKFKGKIADNKVKITTLMGKQGIDLQQEQQARPIDNNRRRPPAPAGQTRQEGTGGGNRTPQNNSGDSARTNNTPAGNENQTRSDSDSTQTTDNRTPKEIAKDVLRNFRGSSEQIKKLDGMGYGDIAAIIPELSWTDRARLRNALKNRLDELGVDSVDESSHESILDVRKFMSEYGSKTPKEKKEFDDKMQALKYEALLHDARRGNIRRRLASVLSREDERIEQIKAIAIEYGDRKTKIEKQQYNLKSKLRASVGIPLTGADAPQVSRGNKDSRDNVTQREIPD